MKRITKGYLHFENGKDAISSCEVTNLVESGGMIEFMVEGTKSTFDRDIPMVLRSNGDLMWSIKCDEDGNNLYEKFPYKVIKIIWRVEYVNDEQMKYAVQEFADKVKAKLLTIFGKTICSDLDTEDITDIIDELLKEYER